MASAAPQLYTAAIAPGLTTSQFHAQDELGQYTYGYAGKFPRNIPSADNSSFSSVNESIPIISISIKIFLCYNCVGGPSAKTETKTADGITRGSYSYVDAHGILQTANYISDPVNGFRVSRTDLPVGPVPLTSAVVAAPLPVQYAASAPVHFASALPIPVGDTPEVAAAKAEHFRAHAEARARIAL